MDVGSLPCLDQWKGLQFFGARTLLICAGVKICSGEAIASFVLEPSEVVKTPGAPWYKWGIWRYLEGLGQQNPIFLQSDFCRGSNQLDFFRVRCVGHDKSGLLVISAMLGIAGYGSKKQPCWDCFTRKKSCLHIDSVCYCSSWHIPIVFFVTIFSKSGRCLKSENMRILRWSHMNYPILYNVFAARVTKLGLQIHSTTVINPLQ